MDTIDTAQTYGRMLRLARRMVTDDADDAAHDAWLLTQTRVDAGPPADAYLRTAIRWARDMRWRADARRRRREAEVGPGDVDQARALLIVAVIEALESLSPVDRDLIWRRHVDGRTPDEIAQATGLRADAIRQRVLRALRTLRQRLDRDYGGRGAWAAIAMTIDGPSSLPVMPAASKGATSSIVAPMGVLLGTIGGLAIAWGMSCISLEGTVPITSAAPHQPAPLEPAPGIVTPTPSPEPSAPQATPRPNVRKSAPADRSTLLAGSYAKQFDADTYRRFRGEVNDSFVECVREWNLGSTDTDRKMSGRTVFVVELDIVPDDRVDVDEVWVEEDNATMREVVDCMQHGLETASLDAIVGTLPAQMRVILDGDKHFAAAKPVIDLEGLPEDLREDHEQLQRIGGWVMGKDVPPGAEAAVARFAEAFADGRIAPGELDDATLDVLRSGE